MAKRLKDVRREKTLPPPRRGQRAIDFVVPLAGIVLLLILAYHRLGMISLAADDSVKTSSLVTNDSQMWRLPSMMGDDARVYDYILKTYPPGTHVHIDYHPMNGSTDEEVAAGRLGRFPLALWPQYPDREPYDLVLRVNFRVRLDSFVSLAPGEDLVKRGQVIDLIRLSGTRGGAK